MQQRHAAIVQRHVEILALAGDGPLVQRHQDADRGIEAGAHVDDRRAQPQRAGGGVAVHAHETGHRLQNRVVAWQSAQRTVAAEAGNAAMDQAGKALRQHLVIAEAPAFHVAGLEVLDQDVGVGQHLQDDRLAFRLAQIDRHRAFVAIDADEVAGVAFVERRAPVAHLVALRRLDLDHVGAVIGQDHRAVRPAKHAGQVDDFQPGQSAGGFRQSLASRAGFDRSIHDRGPFEVAEISSARCGALARGLAHSQWRSAPAVRPLDGSMGRPLMRATRWKRTNSAPPASIGNDVVDRLGPGVTTALTIIRSRTIRIAASAPLPARLRR